jgi:uncharacterized membrane protein YhfC
VADSPFVIASLLSVSFMIAYPIVVAGAVHRRLYVGWRYFFYGALVFLIAQGLIRIPLVQLVQARIAPQLQTNQVLTWAGLATLAVSAGIFEEVGRYFGYRVFMRREEKTWSKGVMYGVGHGGLESMVLTAGLALIMLFNVQALLSGGLDQVPAEQRPRVAQQLAIIAAQPWLFPLLAAFERLCTLPIQVALSVLVLQVFVRDSINWLWLAVAAHAAVDLVAVSVPQLLASSIGATLLTEVTVAVWGLLALYLIWALRPVRPDSPPDAPSASATSGRYS